MVRDELLKHWATYADAAIDLGISGSNLTQWARHGVPLIQQIRIEAITAGRLTADRAALKDRYPEIMPVLVEGMKSIKARLAERAKTTKAPGVPKRASARVAREIA